MIQQYLPVLYVIAAVGLFFVYIQPSFADINELRETEQQYTQTLSRAQELKEQRQELMRQYNDFSDGELNRLTTMLPKELDRVRTTKNVKSILDQVDMPMRELDVNRADIGGGRSDEPYGGLDVEFTTVGTYQELITLLENFETSLRLFDIRSIEFETTDNSINRREYTIVARAYWLRDVGSSQ
jgi:hypothetical protein